MFGRGGPVHDGKNGHNGSQILVKKIRGQKDLRAIKKESTRSKIKQKIGTKMLENGQMTDFAEKLMSNYLWN